MIKCHLNARNIALAKATKQHTIFLKLDLSKAYDKVSWHFLFQAMHRMGIKPQFIRWVRQQQLVLLATMERLSKWREG